MRSAIVASRQIGQLLLPPMSGGILPVCILVPISHFAIRSRIDRETSASAIVQLTAGDGQGKEANVAIIALSVTRATRVALTPATVPTIKLRLRLK